MKGSLHNMGSNWQRDEDLALFHDMRKRERRNFLYPLTDDIDASPTSTPTRTGRDLLPLDSEKNDYDWLLTPPSTPLFPSLDHDGPIVNLSQRRVLTRSASVSKTARLSYPQEPASKAIHGGNPSPKRPSTASSTNSTFSSSRGRPLSPSLTSRSSPTMRSSSPCRTNTPIGRNLMVANRSSSRSLTPTLRRNSTSPSSASIAGPVSGRSRGKSLSPKLGPWEPSMPGFSAEPPPNLRTSLSERTIQRGVSQSSRNGVRIRGSSVEMFDASSQSQWLADSPDGSGNWSLSYTNDRNSSQTSRTSVVSSYDDDVDMAESVLSGSTSCDSGFKSASIVISKTEDSSSRRCVLPAKRQMRSAGSTGDAMPFLSLAARRSYERQAQAQRRSAQTMFRPLLSSAPVTSFYTSRHGGMHLRSSGPFMDSPATQATSRHEGLHVQTATEFAVGNAMPERPREELLSQKQETIEEESESNSLSEEEALGCQDGSHSKDIEERVAVLKGLEHNLADGCKQDNLHTPEESHETAGKSKKGLNTVGGVVYQPQKQGPLFSVSQEEDEGCCMDFDPPELTSPAEGRAEGRHTHQETKVSLPCADGHASFNSLALSKDSEVSSEERKAKANHMEDYKLAASGKTHPSHLGIGSACSQHGPQRVLSDIGSFRKHSPMKGSYTRSYDGLLIGEKNGSCDSMSDSHGFMRSLASALDSGESVEAHLECSGGIVDGGEYKSTAVVDKILSSERMPSNLERDKLKTGLPFSVISTGTICNDSQCNDLETSTICSLSSHCDTSSQAGLHSLVNDVINTASSEASTSEVLSGNIGNPLTHGSTSDRLAQQDVLSILGNCASRITMLDEDIVQQGCTEADCATGQSRRLSDALYSSARLVGESSNGGDLSLRQLAAVSPLKRSVTLEEATDTILFCSSIVHELVYKAATLAIEDEEQKISRPLVSTRDFVALFGFSGADNRTDGLRKVKPTRSRKRQPLANATVCETSSFVQKQRMVHRQTPAVTMRQSPMERIGNAVMGNHEEIHTPKVSMLSKGKVKQGKRVKCRCSCCMM